MRETVVRAANVPFVQFLVAIALAVIVYFASSGVLVDRISVGSFVFFRHGDADAVFTHAPFDLIEQPDSAWHRGRAKSLFAIIDLESEKDQGTRQLEAPIRSIEYRAVTQRYRADTEPVLDGIELTISAGETVAFVGESGSGKTSLVNLLPRLYAKTSGDLLINDHPIEGLLSGQLARSYRLRQSGCDPV